MFPRSFSYTEDGRNEFIKKMLEVKPTSGMLQPSKPFTATVTFNTAFSVDFDKIPVFRCQFRDSVYKITNEDFAVLVSAKTYYSKYKASFFSSTRNVTTLFFQFRNLPHHQPAVRFPAARNGKVVGYYDQKRG